MNSLSVYIECFNLKEFDTKKHDTLLSKSIQALKLDLVSEEDLKRVSQQHRLYSILLLFSKLKNILK